MEAGINNVIYMELNSGPKIANSTCGKTIVAGTIHRGSTVLATDTVTHPGMLVNILAMDTVTHPGMSVNILATNTMSLPRK